MNAKRSPKQRLLAGGLIMVVGGMLLILLGHLALTVHATDPLPPPVPAQTPDGAPPLSQAPLAAPDLIIESIEYSPTNPTIGESVDITVTIKNQGDAAAGSGFYTYLYIDPAEEPPDNDTPDTSYTYIFDLAAGATYRWSYMGYTFSTEGQHPIWAWVDKTGTVAESDETNNMTHISIPVGQVGDGYEPDNACSEAQPIPIDGTVQRHNLNPVGDEDWIRFEAIGGVRYVIEATHIGSDANVIMELHNACGGPPGFGGGQRIEFVAPTSGTYYVKIRHHDDTYGVQTEYDISVTAQDDACTGSYEPNNSCTTSHDIPTDGTVQHHSFCRAGDEDWSRFQGVAGSTYVIEAFNAGPDANVIMELHSSCGGPPGFGGGQRIEWTCPADGVYFIKAHNHDPDLYGANATYDLRITTQSNCQADGFETDDTAALARTLTVDDTPQTHNICPAGDTDWVRFTATAGITYSLETLHPASQADTYLCLYQADGTTQIACDDDSGAAKTSRLIWQAPASGDYLLQVRHYRSDVAGPDTQYDLGVWTGPCRQDSYEPDDDQETAQNISTDGATQAHNTCPAADADWLRFQANAGTNYVIQTSDLGPEADTVLALFNADGDRLAFNDDYGDGLASRISYRIPTSGEYYVQVQQYDLTRFGSGTEYKISVATGTPPPTPSPTPTPTPSPSPSPPPPSEIHTLILVNRARVASVYGTTAATNLMDKLQQLAAHSAVQGEVLQIENNTTIATAYAAWESDLLDNSKANAVAAAIRGAIMDYLDSHTQVEYILLIGGDWIIPFRRVPDQTAYPESRYNGASRNTTIGAACEDNKTLTDDYYADRNPIPWQGRELYLPDYAIARLIETPDEIMGAIDTFLSSTQIDNVRALVTGYDFVQDAATEMCNTLQADLDSSDVDCTLIGASWSGNDFEQKQLYADPPFRLQSINGHANHSTEGAPDGNHITAADVANATANLERAIIYTVGCHAGTNVPPENTTNPLDLAQAFAQHKANYVANTGFGWGLRGGVGLSEALMSRYTNELLAGTNRSIGQALLDAKQWYYQQSPSLNIYDEKILIEATLYGLPQYTLLSGNAIQHNTPAGDDFPSVEITSSLPFAFGGLQEGSVQIGLPAAFGAFEPVITGEGSYYDLDGFVHTAAGEPLQPYFFASLSSPAGPLRGAVLTYARYRDETEFDPVIAAPSNEYTKTLEPTFTSEGWYPAVPFAVRASALTTDTLSTLTTLMGQYDPQTSRERLYDHLNFDLYYSLDSDQDPAIIHAIVGVWNPETEEAEVKVIATDSSGIHRVLLVYTDGNGEFHSHDLTCDATLGQWTGSIPLSPTSRFYVQVVDKAGNVQVESNKGAMYRLGRGGEQVSEQYRVYLPLVSKGNSIKEVNK